MIPVDFLLVARTEYDQSFDWYAERSPQAAHSFALAVDHALARISADPLRWPLLDAVHRDCPGRRFRFRIVFREEHSRIVVVAVAHAKRRQE